MSKDPNLLEAFRNASHASKGPRAESPTPAPASPPASGGGGGLLPRRPGDFVGGWASLPAWVRWLPALLLAFAVGVLVGRAGDSVEAANHEEVADLAPGGNRFTRGLLGGDRTTPSRSEAPAKAAAESAESNEVANPLFDRANQYTVVVVTYGGSMKDPAWGTYDFLESQGIPVYPPLIVGEQIVVFAGAAPARRDLETLEARVKGLTRDGRRGTYGDAYIDRIDDYMHR